MNPFLIANDTPNPPELLERVRREPPPWAEDAILPWDSMAFRRLEPFIEKSYWTDQGSVDIYRVVGTEHPDYQGKTWRALLEGGKRMHLNLPAHATNPGYYLETQRKRPMMYYLTLDGLSYYVGADGNHRTCIARFDFHYRGITTLHGVCVSHYQVDRELRALYGQLEELRQERRIDATLQPHSRCVGREDGPSWKIDACEPRIQVREWCNGQVAERLLDRPGAEALLSAWSRPKHRRWFSFPGWDGN